MIRMVKHPTGKADIIYEEDGRELLFSYGTLIMVKEDGKYYRVWDGWNYTTGRHISWFCEMKKKDFESLPFYKEK